MTKAKAVALAESDEEAVETSLPRSFADGSETISGYFLWKHSGMPEQRVKGNAVPFGGVERRQSLIWVLGRSVRLRGSRARPRPVK